MLFRTLLNGFVERAEIENACQLKRARTMRPLAVRAQMAKEMEAIYSQLDADAKLKKRFDSIKIELPQERG